MICTAPTVFLFTFGISCVIGSGLHERCDTDEDCGTIDTYCSNKICACKEHFAVFYDSCVPLAQPRIRCTDRNQCQEVMGIRSMCTKKRQCVCKPFHHLHLGQCVKNRDLHDICEHDHQCYCGAGCENKIACIGRNCTCKHGHRPYRSRQCIISDDVLLPTTTDVHTSPSPTSATPSLTTPITQYPANETFVDNSCRLFRSFSFLVYVPIVIINFWK
ncbi:uncharacterized protein LOC132700960 [Cylas formicarius]|uniref:uncharacterized protein LOC132700960 n=1 Tax=Cylas formicarius TaxID=197179 RepID=UPI0029583C46|nr:uncharacterized protein LOC132700960 [Cylas formicarius]XP_060524544.1 uncharacterized protein LOC132700960 [Cylas formicarius]